MDKTPPDAPVGLPAFRAVMLAAGAATRMGQRPKCLLELDGQPLVRRQCQALLGAGARELVVVLGHHGERIAQALSDLPLRLVHHPRPEAGQGASLRLGLQSLDPAADDAVLVALADQPLIDREDTVALLAAYRDRPAGTLLVQPDVAGVPGNPVLFDAEVRHQLLAQPQATGGRQWQAAHPEQVHRWPTDNRHYTTDVDSPADIEALAARTGMRLHWPADISEK